MLLTVISIYFISTLIVYRDIKNSNNFKTTIIISYSIITLGFTLCIIQIYKLTSIHPSIVLEEFLNFILMR